MATVIGAKDLIKSTATATQPASVVGGMNKEMGEIKQFVEQIVQVAKQFIQVKEQYLQAQTSANSYPTEKPAIATPQAQIQTKTEYVMKEIDPAKLREYLRIIIEDKMKNLPDDIKAKNIGEITGENFKNFSFKFQGVWEVNHEKLLDEVVKGFIQQYPLLLKDN